MTRFVAEQRSENCTRKVDPELRKYGKENLCCDLRVGVLVM